jgi:hypothetical protein
MDGDCRSPCGISVIVFVQDVPRHSALMSDDVLQKGNGLASPSCSPTLFSVVFVFRDPSHTE